MSISLAVIGGTGVCNPDLLKNSSEMKIETRYGSALVTLGLVKGKKVAFLARHGANHCTPPHKVNYRANIAALVKLEAKHVIATAAVGTLNEAFAPGSLILLQQFLDFTKGRDITFFDGGETGVVHTDFTEPYCGELNALLKVAADNAEVELQEGAVYVCTEGPRFETPAEINMYRKLGGDLVGMTNVPEVVLAREAGLCYSTIALATNFAAGISTSVLSHQEVLEVMADNLVKVRKVIASAIELSGAQPECGCPFPPEKVLI